MKKIADKKHVGVRSLDAMVIAISTSNDTLEPENGYGNSITLYRYADNAFIGTKSWQLDFAAKDYITIALGRNFMYVTNPHRYMIYVYALDSDDDKTYRKITIGSNTIEDYPCAAATDESDNLLMCILKTNQLEIMTPEGFAVTLPINEDVKELRDAVIVGGNVFAIGGEDGNNAYLYMLSITKLQENRE